MNKTRISKIINSGNMNQRMMLLSEEIARVKYGKDNLLTDFEFNSLNDSFQSTDERILYKKYKEVDKIAVKATVNLQGLSFNIKLNNSDLNSYILLSHNIGQSENIVNAVLSNIKDSKDRKKAANFSLNFGRLVFSDDSVDNDGFIHYSLRKKNKKVNLLELTDTAKNSLKFNIQQFKSWKQALIDYLHENDIHVKTYNEIIQNLTDDVRTNNLVYDDIKINSKHYDWFFTHVLMR